LKHRATESFWKRYDALPDSVKILADKSYALLQHNPRHPGLHFKKIDSELWSVRVGVGHRALALQNPDGFDWFWIGTHAEYDRLIG
jgi:hypothetical protein